MQGGHFAIAKWPPLLSKLKEIFFLRSAVSAQCLSPTRNGQIRYLLKTPYNDGTTHVIFEPLDFIARLVALVPRRRVNLTRYHGVFAPALIFRSVYRIIGEKGLFHQRGGITLPPGLPNQ
jgi:hypothetical protein